MTNSTFTKFKGQSFTKSRGVFAKITWVFLMLFALNSFKASATITVASFPDTLKQHSYCITSPQLVLPVVATSNCSGGGSLAYQWYRGGATFGASSAITSGGAPTFSGFTTSTMIVGTPTALLASDTFWVTATETSGGCSQTVVLGPMIFNRVPTKPVVSLTPASPYEVCELELASFSATQVSPTGYDLRKFEWYRKPFSGSESLVKTDTSSSGFTSTYSYTTALSNDQDTVRVSVTNACGTTDTFGVRVNVNPKPIATVTTSNIGVCQGTSFSVIYNVSNAQLHANRGSANVNWSVSFSGDASLIALLTASGTGNGNVTSIIPGGTFAPGTYTATISTITNTSSSPTCTRNLTSQTITVIVYPEPIATFTQDTIKMCYQQASAPTMNLNVTNATYTNGGSVAVNWTVYYRQISRNVTSSCAATANANLTRSAGTHLNSATSGTVIGTGVQNYSYTIPTSLQPGTYIYIIDSIKNTSNNCYTSIASTDTIVIVVDATPTIAISPSAVSICQSDSVQFNVIPTNARYCNGATLTDANWSLTFTSTVKDTIISSPLLGLGNTAIGVMANTRMYGDSLAAGTYTFTPGVVTNTTIGRQACARTVSGNVFTLIVKPAPTVQWATTTKTVCQGVADTFDMIVGNSVLNSVNQNWSVSFTETSGSVLTALCSGTTSGLMTPNPQTGTGNLTRRFPIPATLQAGIYTFTLNSITNTTGSCPGSVVGGATITITVNPKVQVTINPDSKELCENISESFNLTVTNAKYCSALGAAPLDATWSLTTIDSVQANEYTSIYGAGGYGVGNFSTTVTIDTAATLTPNNHMFIASASTTVPAVCQGNIDTFIAIVEPRPTAAFSTDTVNVCVGSASSFNITIANALQNGKDQSWFFRYTREFATLSGVSCISTGTDLLNGSNIGGFLTVSGTTGDSVLVVNVPSSLPVGMHKYALTQVVNSSGPCTGFILSNDTIIVNVLPVPSFSLSPDTLQICENDSANINFTVTNATYCPIPGSPANVNWALYYTDNSDNNAPASPITGSGNSVFTHKSNATPALTPGVGYYKFRGDSIKATSIVPQCANTTVDSVIVKLNPKPVVTFNSMAFFADTLDIAIGFTDSFDIDVTNAMLAGVGQNWTINYKEISALHGSSCAASSGANQNFIGGSGANPSLTISGTGDSSMRFGVPANTPAGVYTYIFNSITNTSGNPNCVGTFGAYDTMVIRVIPKPHVSFSDLSDTICENGTDSFLLSTHATYCVMPGVTGDQLIFFEWTDLIGDTLYTPSLGSTPNLASPNFITGYPFDDEGNTQVRVDLNTGMTLGAGVYTWTVDYVASISPFLFTGNDSFMSLTYTLTVMPNPIARFINDTMAVCEGMSDSIVVDISNAELPANGVNWQVWAHETSGNILTSCALSSLANRALVPLTFTGNGDSTVKFVIPDTLSPGVYEYYLDSIKNLDYMPNCGGSIGTFGKITVFVFPKLQLEINPDTTAVCEGESTPFTLNIINGQYCTAVNSATKNAPYIIYLDDETQSNVFPIPLTGSSVASYTFTANNAGSLPAGYFKFKTDSLRINIVDPIFFSCADTTVKDTFVLVVNPEPVIVFDQALIEQCEGDTNTFSYTVSNATLGGAKVSWTATSVNRESTIASNCGNTAMNPIDALLATTFSGTGDTTVYIGIPKSLAPGVYRYVINGIVNTSATCVGTVGSTDTFIIKVYPRPMADIVENTITICENGKDSITLNVTRAQYCPSITGSMTDYNWSLDYTDNTNSGIPTNPLTGLGNFTSKYAVNDIFALSSGGYTNGVYTLVLDSITNTTHNCKRILADTVRVNVMNLPEIIITSSPTNVCKGDVATIEFHIDSIYATQAWTFHYIINGGTQYTVSGFDSGVKTFTTVMLDSVGVNTLTFDSIQNTTTGCFGNQPFNVNINVLQLPDVDSFVFASNANICSGDTNQYVVRVKNSGGKNWKITYAVAGDTLDNWTGTGNGVFSFNTPNQFWQDSFGVNSTRYVVIQKIEWVSPTTPPLCMNSTVTADSALLIVRPLPWIKLITPPNVCVNTPATVVYQIFGAKAGENWTYDWTLTGPANGPNTVNGSGPSVVTDSFVTPNLAPPGTSTLSVFLVTNSTTGCDSMYNWVNNITVDPPTVPGTLSRSYDICENSYGPYGFKLSGYVGTIQHWDSSNSVGYLWNNIGYAGIDSITRIYPSQSTHYRVIVKSGACPADSSNDVRIEVNPLPGANIASVTDSICNGSNITMVINVTGVPNSQAWSIGYSNTNPGTMTPDSLRGTGSGQFTFTLSGAGSGFSAPQSVITLNNIVNHWKGCDSTLTSTKTTIVKASPAGGTISPSVDTICTASNGSLSWVPGVGNVAYWQSSASGNPGTWTTIPNSTNNVYNYTNLTTTTYFRAVVTNNPCNAADTSASANLTVITGTNIDAQFVNLPSNNKYCATPTGTRTLTYEVTGTNSNPWTLFILEDDSMHVITGTGDKTGGSALTFTTSPGMMTNTFDVTLTKIIVHLGSYSCTRGLTNAAVATIKIIDLPVATVNSVTSPICSGTQVAFTYTVSNIKTSESWKLRYTVNTQVDSVTGTGPGTFSLTSAKTGVYAGAGSTTQSVVLTNIENTSTQNSSNANCVNGLSSSATYTVFSPTVAGTVSHGMANDTVCIGASGNIAATTNNGAIIKWQSRTWTGSWSSWNDIANTTANQGYFTLTNKMEFRAVYQNGPCNMEMSAAATVVPKALPIATVAVAAGSDTICSGATATLNVTVTNVSYGQNFVITYVEGTSLKTSGTYTQDASGVHTLTTGVLTTNTTISLQSITVNSGVPQCANTNLNSNVSVIVQPNPIATLTTVPSRLCQGSTVTFTVNISNVGTTDKWTMNYALDGVAQTAATGTGAGSFTFTTGSTVTANFDTLALTNITNNSTQDQCATALSTYRSITVDPTTIAGTIGYDTTVCKGGSGIVMQTVPSSSGAAIVKWQSRVKGNTSWTDINNTSSTINFYNLNDTTEFQAIYQNGLCASAPSNIITATPRALPTVVITSSNDTICSGAPTSFTVQVANVNAGQSWTLSFVVGSTVRSYTNTGSGSFTINVGTGILTSTTDISLQSITTSVFVVNSPYNTLPSCFNGALNSTQTITVQTNPTATLTTVPSRLCHGSKVTFTVNVSSVNTGDKWTLNYKLDGNAQAAVTGSGPGSFTFTTDSTVTATTDVLSLTSIRNDSTQDACMSTLTDTRTIVVDRTTEAGVIGHDTMVCKGGSGFITQITPGVGSIIKWQSRVVGAGSWTDINNTSTTFNFYNLNDPTEFQAIYQSGLCLEVPSNIILATPKALPYAVITSSDDTICSGKATSFVIKVSNVNVGQLFSVGYVFGSTSRTFGPIANVAGDTHTITIPSGLFTNTTDITLQTISTQVHTGTSPRTPACSNTLNSTQTITVQANPTATLTTVPSRLCHGSKVTFTVNVSSVNTGDKWTMNYQLDGKVQTAVSGNGPGSFTFTTDSTVTANSDVLSLTNITNNATQDMCISTLSDSRTIAVDPTTVAGVIGHDTTVCKGGSGYMTQTATGVGSIIKWQSKVKGDTTWTDINNTSTTINYYNLNDTTQFRAIYQSGLCLEVPSNIKTATPRALPYAVITSTDDTICAGKATKFVIKVTNVNVGQLFSVGYVIGSTAKTFGPIANVAGDTHTITIGTGILTNTTDITLQTISTQVHTGTSPRTPACTNTLNSTQSVTVQMNPTATLTTVPSRLCHGSKVTFTVNVSSVNTGDKWTMNYKLDGTAQKAVTGNGPGSFTFTTDSTVTANSDVLSLTDITNNFTQDMCITTLSDAKTIAVDPTTVAGVIGHDTTVCKGGSGYMTQTAPGVGSIVKWQSRLKGDTTWTDINNTSTTINFYNLNDTTQFRAIYQSGLCLEVPSNIKTATPRSLPYAVITSTDDTICAGKATKFVIKVTNVNVGQLFSVGYVIGSTAKTFGPIANVAGDTHTITIGAGILTNTTDITLQTISTQVHTGTSPRTPACTNTLNSTQSVTVQMNPTATLTTVPSRLCHGSKVTFTVNVSSVNTGDKWTMNYKLDGTAQKAVTGNGPGSFTFTTDSTVTANSDVLSLTDITNNFTQDMCITTLSDAKTIAVDPTTVAGVIGHDTTVCKGGSGYMTQTAPGVGSIVKWQSRLKGDTTWTDINNTSTTINFYNLNDTTQFRAIYQSGLCLEVPSNIKTATPRALPYAVITSSDDTICSGKATKFVIKVTNVNVGQLFSVGYVIGSTAKTFGPIANVAGDTHTITIGAGIFTNTTDITLQTISTQVHTGTSPRTPACTNTLNSTQSVTVQMNPTATLTTVPSRLCHGSKVTFTVNVSSVNTGDKWTMNYKLDGTAQKAVTGNGPGSFTFTTDSTVTANSDVLSLTDITNNFTQDMCISTLSDAKTIAVDPTTVAGVIGNDTIVCKGGSGLVFEKATGTGSIIKWQSRVKDNTAWTDINNNANTIYFFNLNDTTEYQAIYKSGLCNEAPSNIITATPRPLPTATIDVQAATDTICAGQKATLTLTIFNVIPGQDYSVVYTEGSVQKTYNSSSAGYTSGPGTKNLTTGALSTTSDITLQSITTTTGVICSSSLTNVAKATITVIDLPFATITSGPDSICQGSSITFTVNVSNVKAGNTWRLIYDLESDADTITGTGPGNFTHTDNDPNTATSAIITLKEILNTGTPHGCLSSNTDDWSIYIFKPTVAGKIEANDTICKGGNTAVKEVTGTIKEGNIIRWESRTASSSSFTAISNTSLKLDVINLQETSYYRAIYKNGRCDTAISNVIEIVVRELPVATIAGSATVCSGDSTTLNITVTNVGSNQTWVITYLEGTAIKTTTGVGAGSFNLKVGNFLTNTDITLQKIVTVSGTPQCINDKLTNNAKATVVVNQRPFASIDTVSTRICQNSKGLITASVSNVRTNDSWTLTYNVGTSTGLTYSNVGPGTFNITTPTLSNPGYVNIKLTYVKNNTTTCDSVLNTQFDSILVDATTDPGFITGDTTVCNGSNSGVVTQNSGNGSIIRWEYSQDNGSTWTTISNTATTYTYTNLTKTTLFRSVRRNGTCSEATQATPVKVTIREIPVATISGSQTICSGQTAALTVSASNTYSEGWNVVYLEGTMIDTLKVSGPLTSQTLVTKVLTSNTDITLKKIYLTSGTPQCVNNSLTNNATATVNVNQLPVATIVSGPDSVCTGSTATIKINVSNVRTGETWKVYWSINGGNADSATGISAGSFDITTAALTANPSTIKLTRIDNTTTGCFSTLNSTKTIQVDPTTVGGTLSANATVCKGSNSGTLVLGSDARGMVVRWEYSEDNGATWSNISNAASTHNYSNLTKTTKYRVLVRSGACASAYSSEVVITVNELPVATVSGSKTICEGSRSFVLVTVSNVTSAQTWEITYLEGSTTKTKTGTGAVTNDTLYTSVLNQTTDITLQSIKITSGAPLCSNNNLVNNATATITVIDNPLVTISSYPKNVCKGDNPAITIVISKVKSTESWTLLYRVNSGANTSTTGVGSGTFSFNIGVLNMEGPNGVRFVSLTNTGSNPNCTSPLTDSITINVDSTSLGGSLSGPAKVCKGGNGTLTLSGFRGAVQKWQYSTDGTNYFDIANTASTYSFSNLTVKTWFRVIVKNGACPDAFSNPFIVDIQELPTVTIANPTQTICSGSSTTLNLTIGNLLSTDTWTITYKENGSNKTVSGSGTSMAWNVGPFTTTTIIELTSITQTNGLGCTNSATDKATITVLDNPKATISSFPDSLCVGSLVNFKVDVSNVRTTDAWSLDFDINGVSGNKKGTGPGSFTINTGIGATVGTTTIKLSNIAITATPFCTTALNETATIIVTPLSVGGTLSPSTAVGCAGSASGTLSLSGNTGAVQYWEYSTDGGNTWTVTGNKNNTLTYTNLTMTTMYRVYVKSGPCSGAYSSTSTVTIIPLPTAIVVGSPRVCPGVGARFDITVANVGATDNWTVRYTVNGGAVQTVTGTGTGTKSITTAGFTYPNTITVKIVNVENTTYGCVNSAIVSQAEGKVTPNPVPAFTANNACADTIVVFNNNSTIAEGTIGGFKWYFGDGDSSLAVSPTHSYKVPGTYNVRLVALSDNSCTAEITKSITVFANPVARFNTANVCLNVDAQFTDASTVSTGTITGWNWDFGDGATATTQNAAHRYSGAGTYLVTLTVTTNNGCQSMITKSITIYTLPEANFVAQPVCQNSAMKFINASAIGAGDMTYNWDFAGQGTSTQKDPSFTFTGFGSFNVKLLATSNFGCKDSIIRDVTVNPNPVASFTADPRCIGEESNFVNTSSVATGLIVEYYWNFGDTTFSGLQNPSHKYARPGSYTVNLRVKSDKGCESTFTGTADVLALPDVQLTANGATSFCDGDSVTLSANPNARTYNWSWSTGTSTADKVVAKTTGWYKVRITAPPIGCANEDSIFVNVWALPTVNAWPADKITQDRDTINKGESIQLHASGGVNYSWNPTTYLSNGGNGADPIAERMEATTRYIVTVTDINGCVNADTVTIVVIDNFKLVVYNVVTPNGDGYNDRWYIDNIWAYPTAKVVIVNRYGNEVFSASPYDNANGWDGTNQSNGKDLPDGAYFYIITSPDFDTVYTGSINLIRTK